MTRFRIRQARTVSFVRLHCSCRPQREVGASDRTLFATGDRVARGRISALHDAEGGREPRCKDYLPNVCSMRPVGSVGHPRSRLQSCATAGLMS
jgi:hypothetical protein